MQILGVVNVKLQNNEDGSLVLTTDRRMACHEVPTSSDEKIVFKLNKNGKVETDLDNAWAKQCQSRGVQKLLKVVVSM